MKYAWLVIAIFFARFVTDAVAFPAGDGDLAWQTWLGQHILTSHAIPRALGSETFSAAGAHWTPQEWAFSIAVALAKNAGDAGWIVFASLVALGCVVALALVARTCVMLGASPVWTAIATSCAGISIFQSFGVRAQVAAWPLVAALMLLVQFRDRRVWWIVPLVALWSNLHASVLLAPIVVVLVATGTFLDEGRVVTPEIRRLLLVAAASLVATCANPFGIGLPLYAIQLFGDTALRGLINEWQPTRMDDFSFEFGALGLVVAAAVSGLGPRTPWRNVFVLWAFAFLMISAARNIGIFGIVAAPFVAAAVTARVRAGFPGSAVATEPTARERFIGNVVLPGFSVALVVVVAAGMLGRPGRAPDPGIGRATIALARTPDRRLLCEDFAWCSFFIAGGTRDFLDGRADPFPDSVWIDYGKILRLSPGWQGVFRRYGVDAVLAHRSGPLEQALDLSGGWKSIYRDDKYSLLVRSDKKIAAL